MFSSGFSGFGEKSGQFRDFWRKGPPWHYGTVPSCQKTSKLTFLSKSGYRDLPLLGPVFGPGPNIGSKGCPEGVESGQKPDFDANTHFVVWDTLLWSGIPPYMPMWSHVQALSTGFRPRQWANALFDVAAGGDTGTGPARQTRTFGFWLGLWPGQPGVWTPPSRGGFTPKGVFLPSQGVVFTPHLVVWHPFGTPFGGLAPFWTHLDPFWTPFGAPSGTPFDGPGQTPTDTGVSSQGPQKTRK